MSEGTYLGPLFDDLKIISIKSPGDGHCFFHSIMRGAIISYIQNPLMRTKYAVGLRKRLAEHLFQKEDNGKIVYENLSRGTLSEQSKNVPEYSIKNIYNLLNSTSCVGMEVLELTCNLIDINVIIWEAEKRDIYRHGDKDHLFNKNRSTVVLTYSGKYKHYNLLGVFEDGKVETHFQNNHIFISRLLAIW